ncbi:MAG: hypothetical protein OXM62_06975 [bacterium]|nr:hypothetical protein [bacterium]MDE0234734.1 hypothetical protein [bacterium]
MSELWYVLNHWVTIAWLILAAVYAYYAVIADLVIIVRNRKREQESGTSKT